MGVGDQAPRRRVALLRRQPLDRAGKAADGAVQTWKRVAADIEAEWKRIGSLPPAEYERLAAENRLKALEAVEASGAYLLAWARLYRAMLLPPSITS